MKVSKRSSKAAPGPAARRHVAIPGFGRLPVVAEEEGVVFARLPGGFRMPLLKRLARERSRARVAAVLGGDDGSARQDVRSLRQ